MPVFAPEPEVAAKISILPPEASLQFWIAGLSNNSIVAGLTKILCAGAYETALPPFVFISRNETEHSKGIVI